MNSKIQQHIESYQAGTLSAIELAEHLFEEEYYERLPLHDGSVRIDHDRRRRCGFSEVIFGQGKSIEALRQGIRSLVQREDEVLATRVDAAHAESLSQEFPLTRWHPLAKTLRVGRTHAPWDATTSPREGYAKLGPVAVVSAGTTDQAIALEAVETLGWMGVPVQLYQDVGVAGPYRLLAHLHPLRRCKAVVVVAGMEAALASMVGGQVAVPVIAVPTSVGYGASFQGLAALLSMINSCAANITVVNIDAGFKGGYVAGLIARSSF
jgi:hypothetical protein